MSNDNNNYTAPNTAGVGYATEAEARANMNEAERLTELGRRQGAEQARQANLPPLQTNKPTLDQLVPPEIMQQGEDAARAYIDSMIDKGSRTYNREVLDSTKVGALPVDSGILNDARSPGGFPRAVSELTPGSTVSYAGTRISVEQAVRQGLLEVTEGGRYVVPSASARQAQQLQQEQEQKAAEQAQVSAMVATGDAPDAEASAAIDLVTKHVPAQAVTHLIQDVAQNGSLSLESVVKVGKSLGWSEAQAQGAAAQVYEGLRRQADAAAAHAGVPASETDALWNWAAETQATEHSHAVLALAHGSDSSGLKKLARAYLAHKRDVARR